MTSINLLKVAALPGSGSGCQSALPAEKPEPPKERVTPFTPEEREEAIAMLRAMAEEVIRETAARLVRELFTSEQGKAMLREAIDGWQDEHDEEECGTINWIGPQNFGGYPAIPEKTEREHNWTVTRSAFEVEEAIAAGHAVEKLGPAMWKITRPADLPDAAGGGE